MKANASFPGAAIEADSTLSLSFFFLWPRPNEIDADPRLSSRICTFVFTWFDLNNEPMRCGVRTRTVDIGYWSQVPTEVRSMANHLSSSRNTINRRIKNKTSNRRWIGQWGLVAHSAPPQPPPLPPPTRMDWLANPFFPPPYSGTSVVCLATWCINTGSIWRTHLPIFRALVGFQVRRLFLTRAD